MDILIVPLGVSDKSLSRATLATRCWQTLALKMAVSTLLQAVSIGLSPSRPRLGPIGLASR